MAPKKESKAWRKDDTTYHLHLSRNQDHDTRQKSILMLAKNRKKAIPHLLNILVEDLELKSQSAFALERICLPEHIKKLKEHAENHPEDTETISKIIKNIKQKKK